MSRQLNIRSDEAYRIAHKIAERLNVTTTEAVVRALRDYGRRVPTPREEMTPTQQAYFEDLMALARKAAKRKKPGATSDHSDMYDEYGLPI